MGGIPPTLDTSGAVTTGDGRNAVIMGRITHESIGKALGGRLNVVISRREPPEEDSSDVSWCRSLAAALSLCRSKGIATAWICGGAQIYAEAFRCHTPDVCVITSVPGSHGCTVHMPPLPQSLRRASNHALTGGCTVTTWEREDSCEESSRSTGRCS